MSSTFRFPEYGTNYSFAQFEEQVLSYWKNGKVFERSSKVDGTKPIFYFYDGPPFATGLPHYGHLLAGTIKDIVPRYWSKRGYVVPRRFGWDCHGLPVEFEMEKTLNLAGSQDIQAYGVAKFNEACRGIVLRYAGEWQKTVERMGRWIDMDNDYKTMNPEFMESIWWVFGELWKKGLVYEGKKVVPYSWRLTAPLSNFEASLNYKDVQDPAITVLMPFVDDPTTALAIWTTTPWTLPSNLAVAIHKDSSVVSYAKYKLESAMGTVSHVIMAESRAEAYGLKEKIKNVAAAELLGKHYKPLFSCFEDEDRKADRAFRVVSGEFVSASDGTGLVHMAPSFGEDDYYVCLNEKIRPVDPTDMQANFTQAVLKDSRLSSIVGVFVKDADKTIIKAIKDDQRLLKHETLQHAYPFCERSDTPLIYKAISSWFVKVEDIKEKMIANNQKISWVPSHIKDGRFGKWLENARDWCISRNRFWGTPIPVWRCESCSKVEVMDSRAQLEKRCGAPVPDLHKHFVDELRLDCVSCQGKKTMKRTPEVLDCWFESGAMPYAQGHYPFENKELFEKGFPADFIAEGLDQTRGWFYTLTVLSSALFNKPAFKNCIVNGIVLAEDGRKMSKRLKNYPDPNELIGKYGADALRLYLMQSPAMHGEDLRFSEKGLLELMRAVMLPLWNAYSFFASYANIDGWTPEAGKQQAKKATSLDLWIEARAKETEVLIHRSLTEYKLYEVAPALIHFIDDLTNWYIRMNRERFWKESNEQTSADKNAAYSTLWNVLSRVSQLLAPGLPFLGEALHAALHGIKLEELAGKSGWKSVHEIPFGEESSYTIGHEDRLIIDQVSAAQKMILLGRALRGEVKIGIRQPLKKFRVAGLSADDQKKVQPLLSLVASELNVKEIEMAAKASDLVDESAKPNFKTLGKKVGKDMKAVQEQLAKWGSAEIAAFEKAASAKVLNYELDTLDVDIVRKAKPGRAAQALNGIVGELDTELSAELVREGLEREIINRVQQRRKDAKLHLADRIEVRWEATSASLIEKILAEESAKPRSISEETLCVKWSRDAGAVAVSEDFAEHGKLTFDVLKI